MVTWVAIWAREAALMAAHLQVMAQEASKEALVAHQATAALLSRAAMVHQAVTAL